MRNAIIRAELHSARGPPAARGAVCGAQSATSWSRAARRTPAFPAQDAEPLPAGAEVVLRVENKSPSHDLFTFQKVKGGLLRAGRYVLE